MKSAVRVLHITLLTLAGTIPVLAHHSFSAFDNSKQAEVTGVLKEVQIVNPHVQITLAVTDAKGTREVSFESVPANVLYRAGFRRDMLRTGDDISVKYRPRRDGADGGFAFNVAAAATGESIRGFGSPSPQPPAATAPRN